MVPPGEVALGFLYTYAISRILGERFPRHFFWGGEDSAAGLRWQKTKCSPVFSCSFRHKVGGWVGTRGRVVGEVKRQNFGEADKLFRH